MKISSVIHVVCFSDNMLMIFSRFLKVQKKLSSLGLFSRKTKGKRKEELRESIRRLLSDI